MENDWWVGDEIQIKQVNVAAYEIPTSTPESDGTLQWSSTTLVWVEIVAGGKVGNGYSYAPAATASVIHDILREEVCGLNCLDIPQIAGKMVRRIRNSGNTGLMMMAISAIDNALWDLKAKIFGVPLCVMLGMAKTKMKIYGSGGFTSYSSEQMREQLTGWADEGIQDIKIKIGRDREKDPERISAARETIGGRVNLFVDANGAYSVKEALAMADRFSPYEITWFEEPVSSDDIAGMRFVREHVRSPVRVAAGEYGFNLYYLTNMLREEAVDVLQADATRCGGISQFLQAGYLAGAFHIPFSAHCAPSVHLHAALALDDFYIAEYFYDHVRIESMLFEGFAKQDDGYMKPDLSRPGAGIELKYKDAEKFKL